MAIRRKDGSVYKLRGPNKLLITQEFWNKEDKLLIHNFDRLAKVILDAPTFATQSIMTETVHEPEPEPEPDPIPVPMPSTPASAGVEGPMVEPLKKSEPPAEALSEPPKTVSPFRHYARRWLYCLPAATATIKDRLYEEEYTKIHYKDPFRFQGAVVGDSDLRMVFWTTVDQVTFRSVVFQPDTRRWWEVQQIQPEGNDDGIVCTCVPSKVTPDFSALSPA